MFFKQFIAEGMGCLSYLIGCPQAKVACVVDPKRDVQDYIDAAHKYGMKITHVFETHVHADHISGNMEIQSRTGADIYFLEGTPVKFGHKEVKEGDIIELGMAKLEFVKTPGHTPYSMSVLVTDKTRGNDPWLVLTGDCMFVGDVGRPDLAGEEILDEQVKNLYDALHHKLGTLPDSMEIFPAHGEGSLCGRGMSSKTSSTIGFEKLNNPALKLQWDDFEKEFKANFPERPKSFSHIIATNAAGPPLLERCPVARDLSPEQIQRDMERGVIILDARDTAAFGGVHIPGSINIGLASQTANWIGMVIDPESMLVLVVPDEHAYDSMCTHLHRIGYDNIIGYLAGGIASWQEMGLPIDRLNQISAAELREKLVKNDYGYFFDVRTPAEWESGHIQKAEHFPLTKLLKSPPDITKDEEVIVACGVGYRGNIAASFLQKNGFTHVHSLAGGMKAWINAGYPIKR